MLIQLEDVFKPIEVCLKMVYTPQMVFEIFNREQDDYR